MNTPDLVTLSERVADLEEVVATMVAAGLDAPVELDPAEEAQTRKPGPWLWEKLEPAKQVELWHELRAFVAYLSQRYLAGMPGDYRLPVCWYRHPVGVELLTALMVAHTATYYDSSTPSSRLVEFHRSCLVPTLDLLRQLRVYSSCQEEHRDRPTYGHLAGTNTTGFQAFIQTPVVPAESA